MRKSVLENNDYWAGNALIFRADVHARTIAAAGARGVSRINRSLNSGLYRQRTTAIVTVAIDLGVTGQDEGNPDMRLHSQR